MYARRPGLMAICKVNVVLSGCPEMLGVILWLDALPDEGEDSRR